MSDNTLLQAELDILAPGDFFSLPKESHYELDKPLRIRPGTGLEGNNSTFHVIGDWSINDSVVTGDMYGLGGNTVMMLNVDCASKSRMGIVLCGSNNTIEVSHVKNHNSFGNLESFAIMINACVQYGRWIPSGGNLIDSCSATEFKGNYNGGLVIADENAYVHGTIRKSLVVGNFNTGGPFVGCIGAALVEQCEVRDATLGGYTEGGMPEMVYRYNRFLNVWSGFRSNLEQPQASLVFEGNYVKLRDDGYFGVESQNNQNTLGSIKMCGNIIDGPVGLWISASRVNLEVRDNYFSPALNTMVRESTGNSFYNRSSDLKLKSKDGPLKKSLFGSSKTQLKLIAA